jgi:hypothetical protein
MRAASIMLCLGAASGPVQSADNVRHKPGLTARNNSRVEHLAITWTFALNLREVRHALRHRSASRLASAC